MNMFLYVIYDKVAQESGPVFSAKNDGVAMRSYVQTIKQADPSEYSLLKVATYNTEPVSVEGINPPQDIVVPLAEEVR